MSRSITQTSSSGSTVAAGSSVIIPVNTITGFSAGDYVYTLPNGGVGTRTTSNVNIGADTPYVGTSFVSTGLQSVPFRSASYGPFIDQATFSGTTRTFGQVTTSANNVTTIYSYHTRSCTLANGNIVLMYNTNLGSGSYLYFKIIDKTGATIVAETNLTTTLQTSTRSGNFACCTLVSGNIQFVWTGTSAYSVFTAQYSPAGAVVVAASDVSSGWPYYGNLSLTALSGGGSVACGSEGYTSLIYAPKFTVYNSIGQFSTYGTAAYGVGGGGSYYVPCIGLPASYGTNIWAFCSQELVSNVGYNPVIGVYSGGTAVTSATISSVTGSSGGETTSMTFTSDGKIVAAMYYSGGFYYQKLTYSKSTNTTGSLSTTSVNYLIGGHSCILTTMGNGMVGAIAHSGNNINFATLSSSNVVSSMVTLANASQSSNTGNPGAFSGASFGSGYVSASYIQHTTSYVGQVGWTSIAATNGSTVLQGSSSYLPSDGYYFMGVAATDAAANSTGQVIVNGTAQLGSAYPTVTTPIYYSYQTTASQPIFGQRGVVNATTVTLKGLEA